MKTTTRNILIVAAAMLSGFGDRGVVEAQTTSETASKSRKTLAIPIRVVEAQLRVVPASFMRTPYKGEKDRQVEVLDLGVEVDSRALAEFPPSLQPRLYIGLKAYPGQRTEYSNWDARNEKPIDKDAPVGMTQILHFFIEDWEKLEEGQPMVLSVLSLEEIMKATDGKFTVEQLRRIMPELKQEIPRYAPRDFVKLKQDQ